MPYVSKYNRTKPENRGTYPHLQKSEGGYYKSMDPLNYFLIILGGFGVVWSFRRTTRQQEKRIGEFEYAAFSAIWGIPVFLIFLEIVKQKPGFLENLLIVPMMGTLILFPFGVIAGSLAGEIVNLISVVWKRFKKDAP